MITLNLIYTSYQTTTSDTVIINIIVYNYQSILYYNVIFIQRLEIK